MRCASILALICLAACSDWPDAGGPPMARRAQDWPVLLPLDAVLERGVLPEAEDKDADDLAARAVGLRSRAAILRGNASDLDALRARLPR